MKCRNCKKENKHKTLVIIVGILAIILVLTPVSLVKANELPSYEDCNYKDGEYYEDEGDYENDEYYDNDKDEGVPIDVEHFPNKAFRNYVRKYLDEDGNERLSDWEIDQITDLDLDHGSFSDLKGIEYFTKLKKLGCWNRKIEKLDVSKNTALEELYCGKNKIQSLDVSKNTALKVLYCFDNKLEKLDVSKNTALKELECRGNMLSSLDVSKNRNLRRLDCSDNRITRFTVGNAKRMFKMCEYNIFFWGGMAANKERT